MLKEMINKKTKKCPKIYHSISLLNSKGNPKTERGNKKEKLSPKFAVENGGPNNIHKKGRNKKNEFPERKEGQFYLEDLNSQLKTTREKFVSEAALYTFKDNNNTNNTNNTNSDNTNDQFTNNIQKECPELKDNYEIINNININNEINKGTDSNKKETKETKEEDSLKINNNNSNKRFDTLKKENKNNLCEDEYLNSEDSNNFIINNNQNYMEYLLSNKKENNKNINNDINANNINNNINTTRSSTLTQSKKNKSIENNHHIHNSNDTLGNKTFTLFNKIDPKCLIKRNKKLNKNASARSIGRKTRNKINNKSELNIKKSTTKLNSFLLNSMSIKNGELNKTSDIINNSQFLTNMSTLLSSINYELFIKQKEDINIKMKRKKELESSIENLKSIINSAKNQRKCKSNINGKLNDEIKKLNFFKEKIIEENYYIKNDIDPNNFEDKYNLTKQETFLIIKEIAKIKDNIELCKTNIQKTNQEIYWIKKDIEKIKENKKIIDKHIITIKNKLNKLNDKNEKIIESILKLSYNE